MFNVTAKVSNNLVMDALCCAFEGGSNYWVSSVGVGEAPTEMLPAGDYYHWSQWWPVLDGSIIVTELDPDDGKEIEHMLDARTIRIGLNKMADASPVRFAELISGQTDAETGDIFLQYCLLGKIVYG